MTKVSNVRSGSDDPGPPQTAPKEEAEAGDVVVRDVKKRKLTLRQPAFLAEFRILQSVGGETAGNAIYMQMLLPLLFVVKIDDDPIDFPTTPREVEALIQRVGREGSLAVALAIKEHFQERNKELADTIKKLVATTDSAGLPG